MNGGVSILIESDLNNAGTEFLLLSKPFVNYITHPIKCNGWRSWGSKNLGTKPRVNIYCLPKLITHLFIFYQIYFSGRLLPQ